MDVLIWLAVAGVMIVLEIISLGLTTIWFAGGALVAVLCAALGLHWVIQMVAFAVVSILMLVFTRPVLTKYLIKETTKTNVDELIGKDAVVLENIDNSKQTGTVKLNGLEWTARSQNDEIIEKGSKVVVKSISGVKAIVEKA